MFIILLGWYIPLGLVIGYSNLLLSIAISPVPLLLTNVGFWADKLYLFFTNHLLRTTGLLLLFSIKVPAANSSWGHFLRLFRLALQLFNFLSTAGLLSLSFTRALVADLSWGYLLCLSNLVLPLSNFLCLIGSPLLSSLELCAANSK